MRYAVVGADPAGIFITRALYRKFGGMIQIDLYGDPQGAQFNTFVDPVDPSVFFDVGTCFLHRGYDNSIVPLIDELSMTIDFENNNPLMNGIHKLDNMSLTDTVKSCGALIYLGVHLKIWLRLRNLLPAMYAMSASSYLTHIGLKDFMNNNSFKWRMVITNRNKI